MLTIERSKDRIRYLRDGVLHREDGPAIEWKNRTMMWFNEGVRHRIGGPAIEYVDPDAFSVWYIMVSDIQKKNISC